MDLRDELRAKYSELIDGELYKQHSASLTELAYEALEAELEARGLFIPNRPDPESLSGDRPTLFRAYREEKASFVPNIRKKFDEGAKLLRKDQTEEALKVFSSALTSAFSDGYKFLDLCRRDLKT